MCVCVCVCVCACVRACVCACVCVCVGTILVESLGICAEREHDIRENYDLVVPLLVMPYQKLRQEVGVVKWVM